MNEGRHSALGGLVMALRALSIETGSLACLGCDYHMTACAPRAAARLSGGRYGC